MTAVAQRVVVTVTSWNVRRMRAALLATLPEMPKALCKTQDPDLWHPDRAGNWAEQEARSICHRCPEEVKCTGYAIRVHPIEGVWGGTTEAQRTEIVSSMKRRDALLPSVDDEDDECL